MLCQRRGIRAERPFSYLAPWNAKPYSTGVSFCLPPFSSPATRYKPRATAAKPPQSSAKGLWQLLRHPPTEAAWK